MSGSPIFWGILLSFGHHACTTHTLLGSVRIQGKLNNFLNFQSFEISRAVPEPLSHGACAGRIFGAIAQVFFWREKSGPGRRIEHPIGQSKHPKSPNPTLQPCWVHPTKSQNSLQEVDRQFSPPAQPPRLSPDMVTGRFPPKCASL